MAEQPQTIVEPAAASDKPYGARNGDNLSAIFPESPINGKTVDLTDDERKASYQDEALNGTVTNGLGFNSFSRDFTDNGVPDLESVTTGGEGLPASPYVPNPSSPGAGSTNAKDQPEFAGEMPSPDELAPEYGSGLGGTVSPSETTLAIQDANSTLGSYISGRSYAGSDGTA